MEAQVIWKDHFSFDGRAEGYDIPMDATSPLGHHYGPNPKNVLLVSLGGCAGMDVIGLLKKHHEFIDRFQVTVTADPSTKNYPKVFQGIELVFHIEGSVESHYVIEAIRRSQCLYSGVSAMICETVPIRWKVIINGEEAGKGNANFQNQSADYLHSSYDG